MTHDSDAHPALGGEFKSLVDPAEVIEVGRIDLVGDSRPGRRLVEAVKGYDFRDGQPRPTRVQENTTRFDDPKLAPTLAPEDECDIDGDLEITPDVDDGPDLEPEATVDPNVERRRSSDVELEDESAKDSD